MKRLSQRFAQIFYRIFFPALDRSEAECGVQIFKCQELQGCLRSKSCPSEKKRIRKFARPSFVSHIAKTNKNGFDKSISYLHGDETTPEGRNTVVLDGLDGTIDKSIVDLLVGWLTHKIGTDSVKGRHGARHEKSGNETGAKRGSDILSGPPGYGGNLSLGQIVDSHFGGIQDTGSENIGFDSTVKSSNALVFVHVLHHGRQGNTRILVGLGKGLEI